MERIIYGRIKKHGGKRGKQREKTSAKGIKGGERHSKSKKLVVRQIKERETALGGRGFQQNKRHGSPDETGE